MAGWSAPEGLWPIGTPPTRFAPLFDSRVCRTRHRGASTLELPTSHRLPLSWLLGAAGPPLQYRAYAEVVRESDRDLERLAALRQAVLEYKVAQAIARKQKSTGLWGGNLLGPVASKAHGWSEPGTVYQYRRLAQRRESLRIAVALAHNFGIRPILKRWARGLEQPGQGEPMRRREFQGARSAVTSAADPAVKKRRKPSRRRPNRPEALGR